MRWPCMTCRATLSRAELMGDGGCPLLLHPSPRVLAQLEEATEFDGTQSWWIARYLDGYACYACGTVELTVADPAEVVRAEGPEWPVAERGCVACSSPCLGPLVVEVDGNAEQLLVFLAPKFGAPLQARLCGDCGRLWLSLDPTDSEARAELAARFADAGPCRWCGVGRARVTRLDVPHSGFASLYEPATTSAENAIGRGPRRAGVQIVVCDSCGEATPQIDMESPPEEL